MKVRPSVAIIENNHLLLMRYEYGNAQVFNLPGGNTDPGETLVGTLERELREELGIEIEVGPMLLTGEVILPQQKTDVLHCVFIAQVIGGIPILNPSETSALEIKWIPLSEINQLEMYPNVGAELQDVIFQNQLGKYVGKINQKWH